MFEKVFQLEKNGTNVRKELIAGLTTFMTMAYILTIHPKILSDAGMNEQALFTTTALSACIATLIMAFWAKLPFALAPGLGLNAFFVYTVVLKMGYSWQTALTAVFIEGIIFILLTTFNLREAIIKSIPLSLKHAISAGIGLFIAFIGFTYAKLIVADESTLVTLGNMSDPSVWIGLTGILLISALLIFKIKGAIIIGILVSALIGIPLGITNPPESIPLSLPPSIKPVLLKFEFKHLISLDMLIVLFTFLFIDMFDTVGTLVGVSSKANMLDKNGNVPRAKQALFSDAIGTTVGACLGTSTVTTYVESAAGVAVGGKTGLTSFFVAIMFAFALLLSPVFLNIPREAAAPALVMVGLFMMSPVKKINLEDYAEAIPAFLTIIIMPLTMSISEGIVFGMLSYVILKILTGKWREVSLIMYILSVFFVLKFLI
ncbi:MAG: NCS2 family permease [Bacteroidales bacterium]|nr:MAG: NCS2 family permease [Bacteroidales bacterium]